MVDEAKAKSAKDRLDAAKKAAEEAEIVDAPVDAALDKAVDTAEAVKDDAEAAADTAAKAADEGVEAAEEIVSDAAETADDVIDANDADQDNAGEQADEKSDGDAASEPDETPVEEETGGSFAATILKFLTILIVGAVIALWAGPKIAPNLPGWAAPVAGFLTPGTNAATARIDKVAADTDGKLTALSDQLGGEIASAAETATAADQKAAEALSTIADTKTALTAQIEDVASEPRADIGRLNDLATRLASAEATVEGLRAELDALGGVSTDDAAPSAEVLARVAAFGASVEGLRAEIADLKARTTEIETLARSEDLAALSDRVVALEKGEAATSGARDEATTIRRSANTDAALTRIEQAILSGAPYAAALSDATSLTGQAAPAALSDNAATGLPTHDELIRSYPAAAQAAYAASLAETAGEGFAAGVLAKLQGRLGGRPSTETPGDDAGAVLSRVEARLNEGRLDAALAEANGLSETVRQAMQGWLGDTTRAAAGAAALTEYRDTVAAN